MRNKFSFIIKKSLAPILFTAIVILLWAILFRSYILLKPKFLNLVVIKQTNISKAVESSEEAAVPSPIVLEKTAPEATQTPSNVPTPTPVPQRRKVTFKFTVFGVAGTSNCYEDKLGVLTNQQNTTQSALNDQNNCHSQADAASRPCKEDCGKTLQNCDGPFACSYDDCYSNCEKNSGVNCQSQEQKYQSELNILRNLKSQYCS